MIVELTAAQAAEIDNPFWHIELTDGAGGSLGWFDDDLVKELPAVVLIAADLPVTDTGGVWFEHVDITEEDAVLLRHVLDWRAAQTATIAALPADQRPAARTAIRVAIRTEARRDARVADRVAARKADRVAARRLYRLAVRADCVDAGKLEE